MDQNKTGKFIAQCRKEKGLTQAKLAEQLSISEQAVSKWETGRSLPDASLMLALCEILGITVNELLEGERIDSEDYQDRAEHRFVKIQKEKTRSRKKSILCTVALLLAILLVPIPETYKDGGTKTYTSFTYKIVKWNRMGEIGEEDFVKTSFYLFPKNFYTLNTLYEMERSGEPEPLGYGGDPEPFEHFLLSSAGTGAEKEVFEATKTEKGVLLEYYISYEYWDKEKNESVERRRMVRSLSEGAALYDWLCAQLGNCKVRQWDGFAGENPEGVLDGSSMQFTAELSDGTKVFAAGTNNFPDNYRALEQTLFERVTLDRIDAAEFTNGRYVVALPESWTDWVVAEILPDYTVFSLPQKDGAPLSFLIIDNSSYGYYPAGPEENSVKIGRLVGSDFEEYIQVRDFDSLINHKDLLLEEAQPLADSYEADRQYIINSLRAAEGYTLIPEE